METSAVIVGVFLWSCVTTAVLSCHRLRRFAWRGIEPKVSTGRLQSLTRSTDFGTLNRGFGVCFFIFRTLWG